MEWNIVFAVCLGLATGVVLALITMYVSTNVNLRAATSAAATRAKIEIEQKAKADQQAKAFEMRLGALREFRDTLADQTAHFNLLISRVADVERIVQIGKDAEEAWRMVNGEYIMFSRKNTAVMTALHKVGDVPLEKMVTDTNAIISEAGRLILSRSPHSQLRAKASELYPMARKCLHRVDELIDGLAASNTRPVRAAESPSAAS
jgi:hypothetical protein